MTRLHVATWFLAGTLGCLIGVLLEARAAPAPRAVYEPRVAARLEPSDPEIGWTTSTDPAGW